MPKKKGKIYFDKKLKEGKSKRHARKYLARIIVLFALSLAARKKNGFRSFVKLTMSI